MFFFFFFEDLYYIDAIQQAFRDVCLNKMLADGYFDMSVYIKKEHIISNYVVHALKNNKRIIKQDGAFIICGLGDTVRTLAKFRYQDQGKKVVVLVSKKGKILEQLDRYSINRASLFPEIECISEYIKNKYS